MICVDKLAEPARCYTSSIRLRKRQQCCKPKIGGETQVTNKLSSESRLDQIQYRTMCDRCSYVLLSSSFGMGMLHFKPLNLDERSLYLRHEGHKMKLKFMTPRQVSKDKHRLNEKIEKERIEKEEIETSEGREHEEKEKEVERKLMENLFVIVFSSTVCDVI